MGGDKDKKKDKDKKEKKEKKDKDSRSKSVKSSKSGKSADKDKKDKKKDKDKKSDAKSEKSDKKSKKAKKGDEEESKEAPKQQVTGLSFKKDHILEECQIHNKPLTHYSDNTEELICKDCTVQGPHNTQLARVCDLQDAFDYRYKTVNKQVVNDLEPKRALLVAQIVRLDKRMEEIGTVSKVIDRDIKTEYQSILERLRSAEGQT